MYSVHFAVCIMQLAAYSVFFWKSVQFEVFSVQNRMCLGNVYFEVNVVKCLV